MCERPLECNQCKKEIGIEFKEVSSKHITHLSACKDCPIIAARLHLSKEATQNISCPVCKTTKEAVQTGQLLGCEHCYVIFSDILIEHLGKLNKVLDSPKLFSFEGKEVLANQDIKNEKLKELSIALDSALENENYEQAAWLRDRIKGVMEGQSE